MKFTDVLRRHIVNMPGWRTKRKILVIESDDWGSVSIPAKETYQRLLSNSIPVDSGYFAKYDSLENPDDFTFLFELLDSFRDINGNPVCITANAVLANPDFDKIKADNFERYHYEPFTETYKTFGRYDKNMVLWKQGINRKLIQPQFHGREHLNPGEWLRALKSGNERELTAFNLKALLALDHKDVSPRQMGYLGAFDFSTIEEFSTFHSVLEEGLKLFEEIFGFKSKSFIAPTGIMSDKLYKSLSDLGILYLQGGRQYLPYFESKTKIKNRVWGAQNEFGQIYLRRNGTFEPSRNWNQDWVSSVLYDASIVFKYGKPLVLNSHRVNYIGGLVEGNRDNTLKLFKELMKKLLKLYPDIEFFSTDQLGDLIRTDINKKYK